MNNHYQWLDKHFGPFLGLLHIKDHSPRGLIVAHGDKCSQYREIWRQNGIPFEHGAAIYLLTYLSPYSKTVRETENGWVDPKQWVIDHYGEFEEILDCLD